MWPDIGISGHTLIWECVVNVARFPNDRSSVPRFTVVGETVMSLRKIQFFLDYTHIILYLVRFLTVNPVCITDTSGLTYILILIFI